MTVFLGLITMQSTPYSQNNIVTM